MSLRLFKSFNNDSSSDYLQKKCDVEPNDTAQSLKAKVQDLEGNAFLEAIKLLETKNIFHNG